MLISSDLYPILPFLFEDPHLFFCGLSMLFHHVFWLRQWKAIWCNAPEQQRLVSWVCLFSFRRQQLHTTPFSDSAFSHLFSEQGCHNRLDLTRFGKRANAHVTIIAKFVPFFFVFFFPYVESFSQICCFFFFQSERNVCFNFIFCRFKTVHCLLYPLTSWCPWTFVVRDSNAQKHLGPSGRPHWLKWC